MDDPDLPVKVLMTITGWLVLPAGTVTINEVKEADESMAFTDPN